MLVSGLASALTAAPFDQFVATTDRVSHVHMCTVGTLGRPRRLKYPFTITDRFTSWPEVVRTMEVDIEAIVCSWRREFLSMSVLSR